MPVVSGVINHRDRLAVAMGCDFGGIEAKVRAGLDRPVEPRSVNSGPARETLLEGDAVDLYRLPIPLFSVLDGGPMITAGVTLARDPDGEHGLNAGVYRYLVKEKALTGIDIVTPNNLRRFAEKAFARNEPLPISINIGTHPIEVIAATYKAPIGTSEVAIAGGMRGEGLALTPCKTVDIECIADAEIVLEAEILPTGWTRPEGRFGEFTRLMGGLHWNPLVRVKAIAMRKEAVYYALHMPWENIWPSGPIYEAAVRRVCHEAGVQVTAVNITPGGCCHWHAVIAIRPHPGDGKNAITAALSVADMKHVTVVEDDIDAFDPVDVEWAVATRVQADRDVLIISNARSKPLDPSLRIEPGKVPTTAKMGIDATICRRRAARPLPPDRLRLCRQRAPGGLSRTRQRGRRGGGVGSRYRRSRPTHPRRHRGRACLFRRARRALRGGKGSRRSPARSAGCTRTRCCGRTPRAGTA